MRRTWDVYQLDRAIGADGMPYWLAEGTVAFRALPFYASNCGRTPPADTVVAQTWRDYDKHRLGILRGLDWAFNQNAHVFQLALQLLHGPPNVDDPLRIAIATLIAKNRIIVVAAGNSGPAGMLSELATFPDVISVGATTPEGRLLKSSSRGMPDGPRPTLAADGTDPWPQPFPAGTSFAAVRVAEMCLFLRSALQWFVTEFKARREGSDWPPPKPAPSHLAVLDSAFNQSAVLEQEAIRRQLVAKFDGEEYSEYEFGLYRAFWIDTVLSELPSAGVDFEIAPGFVGIKRILENVASRKLCTDPLGCGAGFISSVELLEQFRCLTPSRFAQWFAATLSPRQHEAIAALDQRLGPLLNATTVTLLWHEYMNKAERFYARVI